MANSAKECHPDDKKPIGSRLRAFTLVCGLAGAIALALALLLAFLGGDESWSKFGYAYLVNFAFVLVITLGSLFIVLITHLFRAGWVIAVRRIFETIAANLPVMVIEGIITVFCVAFLKKVHPEMLNPELS